MGKRSEFERRKNDLYETWDPRAVAALLPHLMAGTRFVEPCAGAGALVRQLEWAGHVCAFASDIEPGDAGIAQLDALTTQYRVADAPYDCFISNPPWTRAILHPLIVHLSDQAPCWLLFDADWAYTKQSAPYMPRCKRIVPVGRLKWIPDSPHDGKDNVAWFLFDRPADKPAEFYARAA